MLDETPPTGIEMCFIITRWLFAMILHSQREISARKPGQTLDGDLIVEVKDAGFLFNVSPVYFYDSLLKLLCFLDLELKDQQVLDTCKIYSAYM